MWFGDSKIHYGNVTAYDDAEVPRYKLVVLFSSSTLNVSFVGGQFSCSRLSI